MRVNYLEPVWGKACCTKIFSFEEGRWVLKEGKKGKIFNGYSYEAKSLRDTFEIIKRFENHNRFMIQGDFCEGIELKNIRRAKRARTVEENGKIIEITPTIRDRKIELICFDVDGFRSDFTGVDAVEFFISHLPIQFLEADYIYQFSASYGLTTSRNNLKCHLFFWLAEPVELKKMSAWCRTYNAEMGWGKVLDPAVFVANQPVYVMKRKCLGAADPVENLIGFVSKDGIVNWQPEIELAENKSKVSSAKTAKYSHFSFADSLNKIIKGESFHNELRSCALSLQNQGMPAKGVEALLKEIMNQAKSSLSTQRLRDWETRYADIPRLVAGCFDLLEDAAQEDILEWVSVAPVDLIKKQFPGKVSKKTGKQLNDILDAVHKRTDITIKELKESIKEFQAAEKESRERKLREKLKKDRLRNAIYEIAVNYHNYAEAADKAAKILTESKRKPPVFCSSQGLLYVKKSKAVTIREHSRRYKKKLRKERYYDRVSVHNYRKPFYDLIGRMGQDIIFVNYKSGHEIKCPEQLAGIVGSGSSENFRELTGIVESPYLCADYSIFNKKGYDDKTGLYSTVQEDIKLVPGDVAYDYLVDEVFSEVAFKTDLDKAVMIAFILALMQRPLLAQDPAGMPAFGIVAPIQSSGKTTLAKSASYMILQYAVPVTSFSDDEKELRKHILSILDEHQALVLFDNITEGTEIKSETLAKVMSSDIFADRLLGVNATLSVQTSVVWVFTGNNITFSGDFATRVFPIVLNPKTENPDQRNFKRNDFYDWILERRTPIVSALISILKDAQGYDPGFTTSSRFKIWDKYIRNAVYKASGKDVNEAIQTNKDNDSDFVTKKRLIINLSKLFRDQSFTSRDIINEAFNGDGSIKNEKIGEPLEDILGVKYKDNPKSLGRFLGKLLEKPYQNLNLVRDNNKDRAYWQIVKIDE